MSELRRVLIIIIVCPLWGMLCASVGVHVFDGLAQAAVCCLPCALFGVWMRDPHG